MSNQFVAEVRLFGFNFAPTGWALCDGQTLPIAQNTALFSLLGTNYGGNGTSTFGLPNLQGAFSVTSGQGAGLSAYNVGQTGGAPTVTLASTNLPAHTHTMNAQAAAGDAVTPVGEYLAELPSRGQFNYGSDAATAVMGANALATTGGSQPHNNMPPFLTVNFCIALQGIFPPRS